MNLFVAMAAAGLVGAVPPGHLVLSSITTGDLVRECSGPLGDLRANFCVGYVTGALDALSLDGTICLRSTGSTTLQAVGVLRKFLSDHPERWNESPGVLVSSVLKETFPCR